MMDVQCYVRLNQLLDKLAVDNLTETETEEYTLLCGLIMDEDIEVEFALA